MPELARLYLVRHCQVRNPDGVLYGHLPDFPLSERGVRQAHSLGQRLADKDIAQITCSPLERARQTAEIIGSYLPGVPIEVTDDLIEATFSRYLQGIRPRDVPWRRPLWFIHMLWPGLLPGDESVRSLADRVERPIRQMLAGHPGRGGILVSHGDPIQALWLRVRHQPAFRLHRLNCAKGGMLELDIERTSSAITGFAYHPPQELAELPAAVPPPTPPTPARQ